MKNIFKISLTLIVSFIFLSFANKFFNDYSDTLTKEDCHVRNLTINQITEESILYSYFIDENRLGPISFHPFTIEQIEGWESFISAIKSDPLTTFGYFGSERSRVLEGTFHRFRQYYQGIEVIDGGFTILTDTTTIQAVSGPPCPGCPPIIVDPCLKVHMINPSIYEDINISIIPSFESDEIMYMFSQEIQYIDTVLIKITHNFLLDCSYKLTYLVEYVDHNNTPMYMWVDASSGIMLNKSSKYAYKRAPIHTNAPISLQGECVNLNDSNDGNTTFLRNSRVSGFQNTDPFSNSVHPSLIPRSPSNRLWNCVGDTECNFDNCSDALRPTFRMFYFVNQIVDAYTSALGITFPHVRALYNPTFDGAFWRPDSEHPQFTNIVFGNWNGNPALSLNIVGHELAHAFINRFFPYNNLFNTTLHEGLSDIFGIYTQHIIHRDSFGSFNVDWIIRNEDGFVLRRLNNPQYNCYNSIRDSINMSAHDRGQPLGHWFYLLVNGRSSNNPSTSISPINIHTLMALIVEALPQLQSAPDYEDLYRAMLPLMEERFGKCSQEFRSFIRAWEAICVNTNHPQANPSNPCLTLSGDNQVCEENNYIRVCLENDSQIDLNSGKWTLLGKNSHTFNFIGGTQGNSQNAGNCISINGIPKMPYYPQTITIQYVHPVIGKTLTRRVRIVDCNGDDPTCEEYYGINGRTALSGDIDNSSTEEKEELNQEDFELRVFDLMGNRIVIDKIGNNFYGFNRPQILIYTYWNKAGKLVKSKKILSYY